MKSLNFMQERGFNMGWEEGIPQRKELVKAMNIDNLDSIGGKIIKEIEEARNKRNYL
jgi:hypothetical protein